MRGDLTVLTALMSIAAAIHGTITLQNDDLFGLKTPAKEMGGVYDVFGEAADIGAALFDHAGYVATLNPSSRENPAVQHSIATRVKSLQKMFANVSTHSKLRLAIVSEVGISGLIGLGLGMTTAVLPRAWRIPASIALSWAAGYGIAEIGAITEYSSTELTTAHRAQMSLKANDPSSWNLLFGLTNANDVLKDPYIFTMSADEFSDKMEKTWDVAGAVALTKIDAWNDIREQVIDGVPILDPLAQGTLNLGSTAIKWTLPGAEGIVERHGLARTQPSR